MRVATELCEQIVVFVINRCELILKFVYFQSGNTRKSLELYNEYKPAAVPQNYNIYRRIALDIISTHRSKESFDLWMKLRDMFFNLVRYTL